MQFCLFFKCFLDFLTKGKLTKVLAFHNPFLYGTHYVYSFWGFLFCFVFFTNTADKNDQKTQGQQFDCGGICTANI